MDVRESPRLSPMHAVEDTVGSWEWTWELELPAGSPEEMLVALILRDLVHGCSVDLELVDAESIAELDFTAGDELDGSVYRLVVVVEVQGTDKQQAVAEAAEEILDEMLAEAEELMASRQELGSLPLRELSFKAVPEERERWDLVIPDWLAPDAAEVPFGFRSYLRGSEDLWPDDAMLDRHGRVVLVPHGGTATLFAIPSPTQEQRGGDPVELESLDSPDNPDGFAGGENEGGCGPGGECGPM